jgi:sodium-dependent dicarboxylate transporter 2/3/5
MHERAPSDTRDRTRKRVGLYLGPALFLTVVLLPEPSSMVDAARSVGAADRAPLVALGVLAWVLVWWITECVPLGLAALIVPLALGLSGVVAWRSALAVFMDPIIWIFMAGFVLAAAFRKWDLDRRIAIGLASMYKGNRPMVATLFVACLPVFFLTVTGSITASTTVVFPFLIAYLAMLGVGSGSRYAEASMLALAQAATSGATLLLISTAPNLIAKGTIAQFVPGYHLTFFDWFIVGTPHAFLGLFISWGVVFFLIRPEMSRLSVDRQKLLKARRELGAMSRGEAVVLGLLLVAMTLWLLPSVVRTLAEMDSRFVVAADVIAARMPEAMPAVLVILGAGFLRVKGEPVLRWHEIVEGIDWNIVFLFGGGIALAMGLSASGSAEWLAGQVRGFLGTGVNAWTIFAVSALLGFSLSYAASNTASALVACPIAATLAIGAGVSPIPPILAAALACSISSAIPSTTPPMAIVYSSGRVRIWDMFRVGIVSDLIRLGLLVLIGPFLVGLIL